MSVSVQSRASTDWPAPTCASPRKVVRKRGRCQVAPATKGDVHGPRASVLEEATSSFRWSRAPSPSTPGHHRPSGSRSARSTRRPATVCASSWSTRSRASPSRVRTRDAATSTRRTPTSRWRMMNSTPLRSRATTPSRSTRSSRASKSTSGIWTAPTTSRRTAKSGRTHLR